MVTHNYDNPKTVEELNINLETLVRDISYISLDNTKLFNKSSLHRFKVKLNFMDQIRTFARRYYMSSENRKPKLSDFSNSFISKLFFKTKYCTELCGQERTEEETRAILHEVINRVWENSNLNISELVQNEFDQREEYQKRYEDECLKLDK
ncbi:hypothetical protein HON49_04000, partial [archaeon]|nr:hypothetical protein [archaeon]